MINERECEAAGKDVEAIRAILKDLNAAARKMRKAGVYFFGGAGTGVIRVNQAGERPLILATTDSVHLWDGGAGDESPDADGLMRGE